MKTLVMKFGGAAVATPQHFLRVADIILERKKEYSSVAVVVSAMANATDQLIELAKQVNNDPPRREYDMLISVGERISISLLAMALAAKSHQATSFTGSQSGIITCPRHSDAKIVEVKPHRLIPILESGGIVIVAGFQGVSRKGEITTLGRGGSDTSAVALAAALKADKVEFYKDVDGVFSHDPKSFVAAEFYPFLTYNQALDITVSGAKILHPRAVALAQKNGIQLQVKSFLKSGAGTLIADQTIARTSSPIYEEEG